MLREALANPRARRYRTWVLSFPALAIVAVGGIIVTVIRRALPRDAAIRPWVSLAGLVVFGVVASVVHGESWTARLCLVVPYVVLGLSLFCFGIFATRTVSHPLAGLVMGTVLLPSGVALLWLVSHFLGL